MIGWPINEKQHAWGREFIFERTGTLLQPDCHMLFWYTAGDPRPTWVVAFYDWMGKTCQGAIANDRTRMFPRPFIRAIFEYAFLVLKRKMLYAGVNSTNVASVKMQQRLGFTELYRGEGLQTDGGDIILFGMKPEECRWLERKHRVLPEARPAPRS